MRRQDETSWRFKWTECLTHGGMPPFIGSLVTVSLMEQASRGPRSRGFHPALCLSSGNKHHNLLSAYSESKLKESGRARLSLSCRQPLEMLGGVSHTTLELRYVWRYYQRGNLNGFSALSAGFDCVPLHECLSHCAENMVIADGQS